MVDIIGQVDNSLTPQTYGLVFATLLAGVARQSQEPAAGGLEGVDVATFAATILGDVPVAEQQLVLKRLRPYPRLRLERELERSSGGL